MKANLIRYLKEYGKKSFREVPFSEVDALVLSELSYLKMDGIVPGFIRGGGVSWSEMAAHPQSERMFTDPLYGRQHRKVFLLVAGSRRYGRIRAKYYKEWFDEEKELQFAAVTFFLGETSLFVSFRGTDETLVGWKEDFNMSYMKEVPAQHSALAYLKGVARYTEGRIILGGHSKGGNLAVYAAACADEPVQSRIRRIYSFDGPGFRRSFYEKPGFCRIEERFCKIVPEQSLVGMILTNYRTYRVVSSYSRGMVQHDLMQWKIRNGGFVYCRRLRGKSTRKSEILNAWIDSLSRQQLSEFVELLYELLRGTHASDVSQLLGRPLTLLHRMGTSFGKMDQSRKKIFWQTLKKLFAAVRRSRK